jgi:hypothetical protein
MTNKQILRQRMHGLYLTRKCGDIAEPSLLSGFDPIIVSYTERADEIADVRRGEYEGETQ